MSATETVVHLRKPCPCGKGQILMSYHAPIADVDEGYYLSPQIICPQCAARYEAHYHKDPDRAELSLIAQSEGAPEGTVTYLVESRPPLHREAVDHA